MIQVTNKQLKCTGTNIMRNMQVQSPGRKYTGSVQVKILKNIVQVSNVPEQSPADEYTGTVSR